MPGKPSGNFQSFNLSGMLCPFEDEGTPHVFTELTNGDTKYVWLFDSLAELRAMCATVGITDCKIKRIADARLFAKSMADIGVRVAARPRLTPEGRPSGVRSWTTLSYTKTERGKRHDVETRN